ncbi:MAG TPA: ABC transporter permease [Candidatus Ventrousia excrementavium]|uniref:ABC transporter permease n=1 Tax=Candidatus Ventrousia excrementavium TaxID=2840961 RepID=A0A9D1IUN3_9CLOT|nr:ABC transporter permease [Candidatus Ventrousia excrementavium]
MKKIKLALIPYSVYALIFIVAPILLILLYSFQDTGGAWTLENYARFFDFSDPVYLKVLWRSIKLAVISTVICLILGYPMAYILSKLSPRVRGTIAFLFVLPMWMNFLLRTYSWMSLLERTGLINTFIEWLNGLLPAAIQIPALNIMYTQWAVVLGNVYNFLPFMILPIYTVLIKIDRSLIEAAQDLGASRGRVFLKVIFPLSLPGVVSGISMTFMPAVTTFVISRLLGGGQNALIGDVIENQFKVVGDWGFGSAMSVILMILILVTMGVIRRFESDKTGRSVLM